MTKPIIGILGAGKLGMTLATIGRKAGYTINIAGSTVPEKIELAVSVMAPGANAMQAQAVITNSDLVILALPLSQYQTIKPKLLENKLIIDAMNYWWEIDGTENHYYEDQLTSSEAVQAYFPKSIVVKAFNHMGYHDLNDEADNRDQPKAIAYAGNHQKTNVLVAKVIKDFGFDPVYLGILAASQPLQPGGVLFGVNATKKEIQLQLKQSLK